LRRAIKVGLLAVLLALGASVPASALPGNRFFGVKDWVFHPTQDELQRVASGGVGTYRLDFLWPGVEPYRGMRDWSEYDQIVTDASRAGVSIFPTLFGSPQFVSHNPLDPPRSARDKRAWLRFVRDAVLRYGRHGRFWRTHPSVPYRPITVWQVWNEPSFPAYWRRHPNARQYAAFLKATGTTIKRADRRAKVATGGLPESRHGIPIATFLRRLYRYPHLRPAFDIVAINPYARGALGVEGAVQRVRTIMDSRGDRTASIWITELGWSTGGPPNPFRTTRSGQAARLTSTYRMLLRIRKRYRVGLVVWFSLRDRSLFSGERDWWAPHTGLFDLRGNPKPAWQALVRATGGQPGRGALAQGRTPQLGPR
jgi:polysaccharide biosynthesis protein PslG